jgi:ElaB/YqjD/DUF883 family membrane-anchored ribosome-binding protein
MKHFSFENNWETIKSQLQERYGQLTEEDLAFAPGESEALFARLRGKLGLSTRDLNALLEELDGSVVNRVEQMKAKAAHFAGDARARAEAAVDNLKAKGTAAVEEAKAQAGVAYEEARKRVRGLRAEGEEYVRQNPRETLVGAFCAGLVAGLLLRR